MSRVWFGYCRDTAYFCGIIYSSNILKKADICERISGVVSHSHLFMLAPCQEAIYLILTERIGIPCEFPDIRAQLFIYLFIFQRVFFKHKPSEVWRIFLKPLKMFVWFTCWLKNRYCAYFTDEFAQGDRFGYVNMVCVRRLHCCV